MAPLFPMGTNVIYTAPDLSQKIGRVYGCKSLPYQEVPDIYIVSFPDNCYNEIHKSNLKSINTYDLDTMPNTGDVYVSIDSMCPIACEKFHEGQEVVELHKNINFIFDKANLSKFWAIKKTANRPITNPLTNLEIKEDDIRIGTIKFITVSKV